MKDQIIALVFVMMFALELSANAQSKPAALKASTAKSAVDSLIGHSLYACRREAVPPGVIDNINPVYFDVETPDGKTITSGEEGAKQFPLGSKLLIQAAEITGEKRGKFIQVSLNLLNQSSKVSAGVVVEFGPEDMTPKKIYRSLNNLWFRTHPIPSTPKLGISEEDLYCIVGLPDHKNTDARGDDQLVYWDGQMYVYIGKNGRVTNIQTSFK